jgi:hypothetical protein
MKQRFYIETSVFGGIFDIEFEEASLHLFEKVKIGKAVCLYSDLTEAELSEAPEKIKNYFKSLPQANLEHVKVTNEVVDLAQLYIKERVVGQSSFNDCIHIALASINKADILLSWNFKHIVNVSDSRL